jgi:alcohol dehydrogenase YqhD (iron-dependent ADH family)
MVAGRSIAPRAGAVNREVGVPTRLKDYGLTPADRQVVAERFRQRGTKLGECQAITAKETAEISALCA